MKKALLVIDVQNYFAVEKAESIPSKIAGHIATSNYDEVFFFKFRNDPASNFHKLLNFTEATSSPATDLHPDIKPLATDNKVFEKTTYSAMKAPGLLERLQAEGITQLDLCGISFDACILATAFDAFDLGYVVEVLENLCSVSSARDDLSDAAKVIIGRNLREHRRMPR